MSSTANSIQDSLPTALPLPPCAPAPVSAGTTAPGASSGFVDRRGTSEEGGRSERRQFGSSHSDLSPDAFELATAIDRYKVENRRRYITCEEMLAVVKQLGYYRDTPPSS
ncbi:MAG: hypothetical protein ACO1RT_12780 [Planctomycetaceae bacterium]